MPLMFLYTLLVEAVTCFVPGYLYKYNYIYTLYFVFLTLYLPGISAISLASLFHSVWSSSNLLILSHLTLRSSKHTHMNPLNYPLLFAEAIQYHGFILHSHKQCRSAHISISLPAFGVIPI